MRIANAPSRGLILFALVAVSFASRSRAHGADAVGGGFADSGMIGAYFSNPDLRGEPDFTRRDVRISFNWEELAPIGGSTTAEYRAFPTDGFSVRWTGRLVPRFSEPYRFVGDADDGVRIRLRKQGESAWSTLVDRWATAGHFESDPVKLEAGQHYEFQVEYRESDGRALCVVAWQSPSTPLEIIDPVAQHGLNASSFALWTWANMMKSARYWKKEDTVDEHGWPTEDGTELVMTEKHAADSDFSGMYLMQFEGRAAVREACCTGIQFSVDGRPRGDRLPSGVGYDPRTNTTTATFANPGSRTFIHFDETSRGPGKGSGITNIKLMRPVAPGSMEHHGPTEVMYRPFKAVLQDAFTTVRWLEGGNREGETRWSQRSLPTDAFFLNKNGFENWESVIMVSNETGNDLYITVPITADDEYFRKLALLLRYGSDGREPYTRPTANPTYPPLNPNLRVYVEVGNEIWNWPFRSTQAAQQATRVEAENNSGTWAAINYDGVANDPGHARAVRRWHALRTVSCSNTFRDVFGDDAMGKRVRVLIEYQYNNFQDTAGASLRFIDEYFGSPGSGADVEPHPVNYYVWGGGAASYYGLRNRTGAQAKTLFSDSSFEKPVIAEGSRVFRPVDSPWTFRGTAGIARPRGAEPIGEIYKPAEAKDGKQVAFLLGTGAVSQRVRFHRPGAYAVLFRAVGGDQGWPKHLPFSIYVDGQSVNPRDQNDIRKAHDTMNLEGWSRWTDSFEGQWGSAVFQVDRPGERKIEFVGQDGNSNNFLLIDDVQITSVDALLDSGFDGGEALGQVTDAELKKQLREQAKYARTFGLQVVAYEAGWSVGGDFTQAPLQNWAKLKDNRARAINDRMIELWDESGSFMNVWGVYRFWPPYDTIHAVDYPLMRSLASASDRPRVEATAGRVVPATLKPSEADWRYAGEDKAGATGWRKYLPWLDRSEARSWDSWLLVAPESGAYTIEAAASGDGLVVVEVDGVEAFRFSGRDSSSNKATVHMTKGAHAVRVVTTGDASLKAVDVRR